MNLAKTLPGLPTMKARMIRPERCEKCKFKGDQIEPGKFECRESPPVANSFMMQQGPGRSGFIVHTAYPIVQVDNWCGKFKPNVEGVN